MNSIGGMPVIEIQGAPDLPKQKLAVEDRPGVDGIAFWETGHRGQQFTMTTRAAYGTLILAADALILYQAMIDSDPVSLIYGGLVYDSIGVRYQVIDVRCNQLSLLANATDGLYGWIECSWDLVPVQYAP